MKRGDWVLLDELNLAPQTVLEGLNACFDHREEVFIPEIGQTVHRAPSFRVFCAQNPMGEGGGRKGLPQSLLSRFSRVFVASMTTEDMSEISSAVASASLPPPLAAQQQQMVSFVSTLHRTVALERRFGALGSPWEFNLRDVFRWCQILSKAKSPTASSSSRRSSSSSSSSSGCRDLDIHSRSALAEAAHLLFFSRMRCEEDRTQVRNRLTVPS